MIVAPLAIDLTVILACLVALALILLARNLAEALLSIVKGTAGKIPILGGLVEKGVEWAEQKIVNAMTEVANGVQGIIGQFWHALGNLISSVGHEIYGLSVAFNSLVDYLYGVVKPWVVHSLIGGLLHGVKWLKAEIASIKAHVWHVTTVIEHPIQSKIGGAVRTITKPLAANVHALERWVRIQIAAVDHAIDVVLPRDIAGLRARDLSLSRLYEWLRKQIARHERLLGAGALTAAVAYAIGRLGGGWIRCQNWNKIGRSVCRLPLELIESLLGIGLGLLAVIDPIVVAEAAEVTVDGIMGVLEQIAE